MAASGSRAAGEGRFALSLSTASLYSYPLRTLFRWASSAGFDGIELAVGPEAILRGGQALRQLASQAGLAIFSVHPPLAPIPGWRERRGGMAAILRLASQAGAGMVVIHVPHSDSMAEGEGLAFQKQVDGWRNNPLWGTPRITIENKAIRSAAHLHYALTPANRLRQFADEFDLGLVLDTCHAASAGDDLIALRSTFGSRLANVHLSDTKGQVIGRPSPGTHHLNPLRPPPRFDEHRFPGSGGLPLQALLRGLVADGYLGPVTLEVSPLAMRMWWPPAARRRLLEAVTWVRQAISAGAVRV